MCVCSSLEEEEDPGILKKSELRTGHRLCGVLCAQVGSRDVGVLLSNISVRFLFMTAYCTKAKKKKLQKKRGRHHSRIKSMRGDFCFFCFFFKMRGGVLIDNSRLNFMNI